MDLPGNHDAPAASPDVVYRAISRASHKHGRLWPSLAVPVKPQRWNREDQPTIYASHEPEVAAAEKLPILATSPTLRTARAFWSAVPPRTKSWSWSLIRPSFERTSST